MLNLFLATQDEGGNALQFRGIRYICVISLQMHSPSKKAITESRTPLKTLTPKVCPFRIKGLLAACLVTSLLHSDSPSHDLSGDVWFGGGKAPFWYHK